MKSQKRMYFIIENRLKIKIIRSIRLKMMIRLQSRKDKENLLFKLENKKKNNFR